MKWLLILALSLQAHVIDIKQAWDLDTHKWVTITFVETNRGEARIEEYKSHKDLTSKVFYKYANEQMIFVIKGKK